MSEFYIPRDIDGLKIDLTELVAKVRADAIEEILKLPRNTYKTYEHGFVENEEAIFVSDIFELKEKK